MGGGEVVFAELGENESVRVERLGRSLLYRLTVRFSCERAASPTTSLAFHLFLFSSHNATSAVQSALPRRLRCEFPQPCAARMGLVLMTRPAAALIAKGYPLITAVRANLILLAFTKGGAAEQKCLHKPILTQPPGIRAYLGFVLFLRKWTSFLW